MLKPAIEKQINILDYALSSLWRRKMKNISVMLVFAVVIFLIGSFQLLTRGLTQAAARVLVRTPEITVQKMSAGRQEALPAAYMSRLNGIFGISRIVPRIWGYYFDEVNGANYTVMGLDPSMMPLGEKLDLTLDRGRMPLPDETGQAVIGRSVQKKLVEKGGGLLTFFRPDLSLVSYEVAGVFDTATDLLTNDLVVLNIDDARDLFGIAPDRVTDLCVYVANKSEIQTIARKIARLLPDTRVLTRPQIQKTYQVVFSWRSGFASVCLLTALTAFIILAWDKASGLSPEERREIAILKILGWETTDILTVRFWESLLVSSLAFLIGCTLAYVHVVFFDASLFRPVLVGWSVIFPAFHLAPALEPGDFLLIFSFSVLPYLAATVIPAWRCATVPPDSALGGR